MSEFDLTGALRRIRRDADLSQRELARRLGVAKSTVAAAEAGTRDLPVGLLARAAALASHRLALLGTDGQEVAGMADDAVRDMLGRRFPAHLDTRYSDEDWWHGEERHTRRQPWYTFDRDRNLRDAMRNAHGRPDDHQLPQPGDSPRDRTQRRRAEAHRRREEEWQRRLAAGEVPRVEWFTCCCPPECAELDQGELPIHAPGCPCGCDID